MAARTTTPLGWRRTTAAVAAAASIAALAACGSTGDNTASGESGGAADAGSDPTTVEFWGWVPGLEDLVAQWNDENPDIQVNFHRMTGDDGQKVEAAVDAGAGPDLVQLSTHSLPDYVIQKRVQDITEYVSGDEANYTPAAWASVTFDGHVYGVPQGIGPTGMMYRQDILDQYGIPVPTTWDEYLQAARDLHAANPDVYIANLSPGEIGQWMQEVQQAEGSWYGIDGDSWTVGVNDAASKQVAERWQTLLDEGLVTTELMWTPEYWSLVNAGTIATISYAAWFPNALVENAADTSGLWRVAPMPTPAGSDNQGDSGGAAVVVLAGAEQPAAAAAFASWLNGSDETQEALIVDGGLFPSTINGLANPALMEASDFFGGQVINEVFAESAAKTPATWVDGPDYGTAQTAVLDEFAKVVAGSETFVEALDNAQAAVVADLEARGLSVSE
ncbi:extracellular solute-binding protein [Actinotalea sp. M2MS4P-6]|uniref:ABC transporter substrate-binding protein n=1 Tax=Actinotalea sp. M2MS4P-6 TaxID=2983762 RepID=UPI0021E4B23E|nr:extracellular solute-binding protein [Actinotalea sp. M2MS4P-6]MCV2394472.1 extracellular solute-binding protein [Actinotalea sp. M2MS4P-6]